MASKFPSTDLPKLKDTEDDTAVKKSILDLLDKINSVADAQYPVGYVYTQYPGTSDPATLFGGTWLNITSLYGGLFFRAEGGSSLAFNAGNQTDLVGPHSHTASSGGSGALGHTHSVNYPTIVWGGSPNNPGNFLNGGPTNPPPVFATNSGTGYTNLNGSTSGTNASIDHTHTITVNATTTSETRPVNTTIRIWQRSGGSLTTTTGTSVTMGIYDSGTNSNGSWIRFTDGTMMQWGSDASGARSFAAASDADYNIPFPQSFVLVGTIAASYSLLTTAQPDSTWAGFSVRGSANITLSNGVIHVVNTGALQTGEIRWQATGKWR
jgi:hypothetical protein